MLKRFWFEFEPFQYPTALNTGCGVTGYDYDDALELLQKRVFAGQPLPKISRCVPEVDVRDLDQDHVVPNMGIVTQRGVWFPQGF